MNGTATAPKKSIIVQSDKSHNLILLEIWTLKKSGIQGIIVLLFTKVNKRTEQSGI